MSREEITGVCSEIRKTQKHAVGGQGQKVKSFNALPGGMKGKPLGFKRLTAVSFYSLYGAKACSTKSLRVTGQASRYSRTASHRSQTPDHSHINKQSQVILC